MTRVPVRQKNQRKTFNLFSWYLLIFLPLFEWCLLNHQLYVKNENLNTHYITEMFVSYVSCPFIFSASRGRYVFNNSVSRRYFLVGSRLHWGVLQCDLRADWTRAKRFFETLDRCLLQRLRQDLEGGLKIYKWWRETSLQQHFYYISKNHMLGPPFGTTSLSSSRKTWTHILFSRAGNKTVEYIIENLPSYVNSLKFKKKIMVCEH